MFIRSVTIERFRGVEHLEWQPASRVNCLIGPGDAGKSTILAAIELTLDPRPAPATSEYDYFRRRVEDGFQITLVLGDLDQQAIAAMRTPPLHGWLDGQLQALPDEGGAEAVLVARVIGSPDLELAHVLVEPDAVGEVPFPVAHRRRLLLSRVSSGARAATEFRLGRGTLLDRHASGSSLRAALRAAVAAASAGLELPDGAKAAVASLQSLFADAGLPDDLHLSIITPQGWSLLTLVGLLEGENPEEAVPLASAGSGTRQLALFRLAAALMEGAPIVLLDEPELGLEPYRQRRLVAEIRDAIGQRGQAFLTTHSPAVLEALQRGEVTRMSPGGRPLALGGRHIARVQTQAPDALLSRLPLLAEGPTEAGLLRPILNDYATKDGLADIDALGVRVVARTGQPTILDEADELLGAGVSCGVFLDNERDHAGRREALAATPQCAAGIWVGVRNIEEAVAAWLPWHHLARLLQLVCELRGNRPPAELLQQVGECLGRPGEATLDKLREEVGEAEVRTAIAAAMQSKSHPWFKTFEGGDALGHLLVEVGLPPEIEAVMRPFWERVRQVAGWD